MSCRWAALSKGMLSLEDDDDDDDNIVMEILH